MMTSLTGRLLECLSQPAETTAKNAFWIGVNASAVLLTGFFVSLLLRHLAMPPVSSLVVPLNFIFDTCQDQLGGICSFPTANVSAFTSYAEPIFASGTAYSVSMHLQLSDCLENAQVGMFLVVLRVLDSDLRPLAVFPRGAMFRKRSGIFNLIRRLIFLPFYLIGWTNESEPLHLEFTNNYMDGRGAARAVSLQLQNKFVVVDEARLHIEARFGLFRSLLNSYPLLSGLFIAANVWALLGTVSCCYWTLKSTLFLYRMYEKRSPRKKNTNINFGGKMLMDDTLIVPDCPQMTDSDFPKRTRRDNKDRKSEGTPV